MFVIVRLNLISYNVINGYCDIVYVCYEKVLCVCMGVYSVCLSLYVHAVCIYVACV